MSLPSTTPATAARVTRLDRSIVCGKALAAARRQARLTGRDYRRLLSACMAESWRLQKIHTASRVAMTIRVLAVAEELKAEGRRYRAEFAASIMAVQDERARQAEPMPLARAA
jgi:SHS2 domain-containing protein